MTFTRSSIGQLFAATALAALSTVAAAQTAPVFPTTFLPTAGGMWSFNTVTGRAAYCLPVQTASGAPMGKCNVIGSVGTSASGFILNTAGSTLMVVSRTTGAIFQCSITLMNGINPVGGCAQISSTNLLS